MSAPPTEEIPLPSDQLNNSPPPPHSDTRIIVMFLSVQFIGFFLFDGLRTIFPLFLDMTIGLAEDQVVESWGLIYSFGVFVGFLTRMPMGVLADRYPRRVSLTIGIALGMSTVLSLLFIRDILLLAVSFGLLRMGVHLFPLVAREGITEVGSKKHGRLNSLVFFAGNVGSILGPVILALVFEMSLEAFVFSTLAILLVSHLTILLFLPKKSHRTKNQLLPLLVDSFREVYRFKTVLLIFLASGFLIGVIFSIQVPYALYVLKLSSGEVGIVVGLVQFLNLVIVLVAGELIDSLGSRVMLTSALLLELIAAGLLIASPFSLFSFTLSQVLFQGGISILINSGLTLFTLQAKKRTFSTVFGAITSLFFLGSSISPTASSQLYLVGPTFPFWLVVIIALALLPTLWLLVPPKKVIRG